MRGTGLLKLLVSIVAAAILGIIGSRYLFVGSWLSLVPWAIAGLALGYWSQGREWIPNGAAYGFALAFVFMIAGYSGSASLLSRLPFFALLGIVGAMCGLGLGLASTAVKAFVRRSNKSQAS